MRNIYPRVGVKVVGHVVSKLQGPTQAARNVSYNINDILLHGKQATQSNNHYRRVSFNQRYGPVEYMTKLFQRMGYCERVSTSTDGGVKSSMGAYAGMLGCGAILPIYLSMKSFNKGLKYL